MWRFVALLKTVTAETGKVIIIDNGSKNKLDIEKLCRSFSNIEFIEMGFNSGVRALNTGIKIALEMGKEWILLLDDDTSIKSKIIQKTLKSYEELCKTLRESSICYRIATIRIIDRVPKKLERFRGSLILLPYDLGIFSGTLIRAEILKKHNIRIREGFFLDQADFDFFNNLRKLGYLAVIYIDNLIKHRLGEPYRGPVTGLLKTYQNSYRYYLIVRNATILLLERAIPFHFYVIQIIRYFIPIFFIEGVRRALKSLIMGLTHGLFKKEGYLHPTILQSNLR
jgi:rhamnosyltransferase